MKARSMHRYGLWLSLVALLWACKKEEQAPDFTGSYLAISLRSECTNAAANKNYSASAANEICLPSTGGQTCLTLTLILKEDKSYTLSAVTKTITNGVTNTKSSTDVGTYTVSGNTFTMCTPSNSCFTITQTADKNEYDWLSGTSNGCNSIYTFKKT